VVGSAESGYQLGSGAAELERLASAAVFAHPMLISAWGTTRQLPR
jgi:hypothetical protein